MKGYSLIEIMLSLFLASIVITTLMHYYFVCQQQYFIAQKSLEEGLELHALSEFIQDSIRRAGFTPCLCLDNLSSFDHRSHKSLQSLQVLDNSLKISRMSENFYAVKRLNSTTLLIPSVKNWPHSFPIIIADCYHAEVSSLKYAELSSEGIQLRLNYPLHYDYEELFYVGEWVDEAFFVEKTKTGLARFYYQTSNKEKLTNLIEGLMTKLSFKHSNKFVHMRLQGKGEKTINIDAKVRSC